MLSIKFATPALLSALTLALAGCSEHADDAKYASLPPQFEDMTFATLTGNTTLQAGDKIVATAVQSKKGRLLNGTTYTWSTSPIDGITHGFKRFVIYDNESNNPTDTLTFATPGTYTVKLEARYKSSGNNQNVDGTTEFEGGRVTYKTGGLLSYTVTVEKTVVIK